MHERGWLYLGHRSTEWCPRCGTSLSQHELSQSGVYQDRADPSLFVRFPLLDRPGESLVVWTTTPWTLPANVAAAVKPDAEYGRRENGEWVAVGAVSRTRRSSSGSAARSSSAGATRARSTSSAPGAAVEHRVIPWDDVTLDEGTGIVHIAPGCGGEDFELVAGARPAVLTPVDEAGRFYDDYGWLHGLSTVEAADQIVGDLGERGLLVEAGLLRAPLPALLALRHAAHLPRSPTTGSSPSRSCASRCSTRTQTSSGRRRTWASAWTTGCGNMGDWNISRRRYYGLPLPFYPCACGHLNVIGSKAELEERALAGLDQLEELRRPWIDDVPIRCERAARRCAAIAEVGDVWLDAGIVPFSTLGWQNPEWVPEGYATGAAKGLTTADLPDHAYWEQWFPADWVSEMREQIRLWFYSQLFMSVVLTGRAPFRQVLGYEKMLDENGREMHGSWGNMIEAEDAFARMGADVMRWQFCAQPPDRNLLFGFGPAHEIQRKLLTLWNSARFLVDYGEHRGLPARRGATQPSRGELRPLDRWLARAHGRARRARRRRRTRRT